ncbi:hypothetical protein BD324DRAFT_638907 [Kockovaella imperatae]|uniref:CHCH domain-containing protein n=1 Tax=Kockovaella imperatae TaxID=4999 RepID=A0A1Y1U9V6_9TREE|nr:hypothetical protein BD324DRAFT_638907 [Kockovaella imperatae]ORX33865.1 hypothetical protein BD324DRAFT_638907 [Kockovaella imperatae]
MPRSSGGGRSRPAARPAAPPAQQTRQHSTTAQPYQNQAAAANPATQVRPPGLLAQAASTMGGAVAGSVVGHGISNMLFGGRSQEQMPPPAEYAQQSIQQTGGCDIPSKDFTKCLDATNGDMTACGYYLEALKACQAAAKNY